MANGLSDPIFALFVILMVLLFFLLLLKRLYRNPSPMDLQFESLTPPMHGGTGQHPGQIQTISVAVHHHHQRNNHPSQVDTTPPPSFEEVVTQKSITLHMERSSHDNPNFVDDMPPPPSYQEYLSLQKEGYREQGKI